jgi:peptidoglycan/xylan/chitin deacetylase (PgdA/CDA1 family)
MLARLKTAGYEAAVATGLSGALARTAWRAARLCILCYHGLSIDDEHLALPELYVTEEQLRRRFETLARGGYAVLPLAEAVRRLAAGSLPPRCLALTFDDGTRDFALLAAPLLQEYGFPATVYVTSYYSDKGWPVFDTAMRYMRWRAARAGLPEISEAHDTAASHPIEAGGHGSGARKQEALWAAAARARIDFESFLAKDQFKIMTAAQLAALPPHLVDVQMHTHRHRTPRDAGLFRRELEDNRRSLARALGARPFTGFCYPSGDYAAMFLPWLAEEGVEIAVTCAPGLASAASHPLLLPRYFDTSLTSDAAFLAMIDGVADLTPRRRANILDATRA